MNNSLLVVLIASGIAYGTPLLFASLGELLAERSGVLNLGVEGMMLVGAVMGFWTVQRVHVGSAALSLILALVVAALSGAIVSSGHAFLVITYGSVFVQSAVGPMLISRACSCGASACNAPKK